MNELISVIVPVYKVEEYLRRCIDSIINQTYKNLEIILVDDGSPDNCGKICDEYAKKDDRINVIHKENGGLSDARNAGIDIANGKYITFIDSDDYVSEDYVEFLYSLIKENNADISMGKHFIIYKNDIINTGTDLKNILKPKEALEKMLYSNDLDVSAWAKLYKKELFQNIKYPKGRLYEDAATTYKLIDKSKIIAFYSKPIYYYVIRDNSITNHNFNERKFELIDSTKEMCEYVNEKYPELKDASNRRLMYSYLSTLTQLTYSKEIKKEYKKRLMNYIKENRNKILKNKKIPQRDKIALYSTYFGFSFFKLLWKLYRKITGRN